ncbi:sialidase-2-like [Hemiscyllium ocellatum]|uniref:sialidase-2-like n=1 Tax=Hemiscyllium ocellatum TaxID=170820 RepID=UPI002967404C|nr:sialidase-2-like [Hemiscyllium ocellatum]
MASSNSSNTTVLFKKEDNFGYRIPALLHIPDTDMLLAISEKRLGPHDENADTLMLRKGTYNKSSKNFEWDDVTCIESARLKDHRSMNPCPVYDKETGKIFLFFIAVYEDMTEQYQINSGRNVTRLCFVTSVDGGKSWSPVNDLTDNQISEHFNNWATFAVGPGHGIQLRSGRLIIPAYAYKKKPIGQSHAFTFYSDDHGEIWSVGDFLSKEECGECQIVAMNQGNESEIVYCNARSMKHGEHQYRVQAFSTDGGATFTDGCLVKKLVEPPKGCHGSIIHFPKSKISKPNIKSEIENYRFQQEKDASKSTVDFEIILFSHTTSMESRRDLGIYLCTYQDHPLPWTDPWIICPGPSGYSELAFIEIPGIEIPLVACLFECGSTSESDQISFTVSQVDEIIQNILEIKPHDSSFSRLRDQLCFCTLF